jgi:hypothetical protein
MGCGGKAMKQEPGRIFNQAILSVWQEQIEATHNPSLKEQVLQRERELLPRFVEHYQQLKALRRRVRRGLQRQWKRSLAGVALLLALGQAPALAATINVGGACTLVRAIVAANTDTTATGNCTKGSGADRIVLPAGSIPRLTAVNNTVYGPTGLPVIRTDFTIAGHNSTIRRARTTPEFRIVAVGQTGDLTLQRATVSRGRTAIGASDGSKQDNRLEQRMNLDVGERPIPGGLNWFGSASQPASLWFLSGCRTSWQLPARSADRCEAR